MRAQPLSVLSLPACNPQVAACWQALRGRAAPQPVRLAGADLGLEWHESVAPAGPGLETALRIGPWRYLLRVDTAGGNFAPMGMDTSGMPPVVLRVLLAEYLADAVQAIERSCGLRVDIEGAWNAQEGPTPTAQGKDAQVGFLLRDLDSGLCTRAALLPQDAAAFSGLAQLCTGWPWRRAGGREPWPLRCRLMLGTTRLAAWELAQLDVADVLFIEHPPPGREPVRAALCLGSGETSAFLAQVHEQEVVILDDNPDHQVSTGEGNPTDAEASLLDRLELTVRFWIGGRRLAWREIQSLQEGSVITLDHNVADAEVQLVVDGQRIGRGKLVAVGERLGVRIASIASPQMQAVPRLPGDESTTLS